MSSNASSTGGGGGACSCAVPRLPRYPLFTTITFSNRRTTATSRNGWPFEFTIELTEGHNIPCHTCKELWKMYLDGLAHIDACWAYKSWREEVRMGVPQEQVRPLTCEMCMQRPTCIREDGCTGHFTLDGFSEIAAGGDISPHRVYFTTNTNNVHDLPGLIEAAFNWVRANERPSE